jgi:SiaC family regulatory phosphoprotein
MKSLSLSPTTHTPYVSFDAETGKIELKGRSTPENSVEFYEPIMNWLDDYVKSPQETTVVEVKFEYFNTSSSKCILDIFKRLSVLPKNGKKIQVTWYYEEDDEDMQEAGEDYSDILGLPFTVKQI